MALQKDIDARAIADIWETSGNDAAHALFLELSKDLRRWEALVLREAACKLHSDYHGVTI